MGITENKNSQSLMGDPVENDGALRLERLHHDILAPLIDSFLDAVAEPAARETYLALKNAVEKLEVPAELLPHLGAVAEVALTSGRVRHQYGPGAELALWSIFQKTPRGRELAASVDAVNAALKRLRGQPLEELGAVARGPGAYSLTLRTAELQMVLRFEPAGVRIESLDLDLA
jgi:hypothetical protein